MADTKEKVNPFRFLAQVRQEARKVTWTGPREVIVTTIMVMIVVTLTAIFFYFVDSILAWIIGLLLGLFETFGGA